MAQPYVGEIRMFAGNFAPAGWMFCEGQLLPISENETLFQLIGTTYGGDGEIDVRAARPARPAFRSPGQWLHPGRDGRRRGDHADREPDSRRTAIRCWLRRHRARRRARPTTCPAQAAAKLYRRGRPSLMLNAVARCRRPAGSQPHTNFQPYLCVDFIISLFGIFPSPT